MLTYQQALLEGAERLQHAGSQSAKLDALVLLSYATKRDKIHLYTYPKTQLSIEEYTFFDGLLARREKGEPIAYLLREKDFWESTFFVQSGVLIPRPDTETLLATVLDFYGTNHPTLGCDLGTGSGALALSLAQNFPNMHIFAADVSDIALECAQKNAASLRVEGQITFVKSNWFESISPQLFDFVISNPPYITQQEMPTLMRDVRDYEPHLALYGGVDGLDAYRAILTNIATYLKPEGLLAFEVGAAQSHDVSVLLTQTQLFTDIGIKQDFSGVNRVVFARRVP